MKTNNSGAAYLDFTETESSSFASDKGLGSHDTMTYIAKMSIPKWLVQEMCGIFGLFFIFIQYFSTWFPNLWPDQLFFLLEKNT